LTEKLDSKLRFESVKASSEIIGRVKIYTRTGDSGDTALFDGTRVSKADPRVAAYGEVDELNAWLGLAIASSADTDVRERVAAIQRDLFALGARLADPSHRIAGRVTKAAITPEDVARLERWIDSFSEELPPLRRFVLPGGSPSGAALHVARTVCRRAERAMVDLGDSAFEVELLHYINRLSDLLFTMARAVNHRAGAPEIEW
jgi:cob(I)alamin adenosyltransferase